MACLAGPKFSSLRQARIAQWEVCISPRSLSSFLPLICPCVLTKIPFFFTSLNILFLPVGPQTPPFRRAPMSTDQARVAYMAALTRHAFRDAYIYTSDGLDTLLGGLWVAEGITNANLYSMMEIFCIFSDTFGLHYPNGKLVERDQNPLQPGDYFLATNGRSPLCLSH